MMATAFLGYEYSPKWFNISVFCFYVLFTLFLFIFRAKENVNISRKVNIIKKLEYKVKSKRLFNKSIIKRECRH